MLQPTGPYTPTSAQINTIQAAITATLPELGQLGSQLTADLTRFINNEETSLVSVIVSAQELAAKNRFGR